MRITECILYFFYKNFTFTAPLFYYGFYNAFTAMTMFDDYFVTLYNCVFTFWPVIIRAIFEQDIYYDKTTKEDRRKSIELVETS